VAHDLRTPMTRLRGTAEMALQSGRTVDELREALADCIEEVDRVRSLLDALMDLSEAETGAMRLRRDQVNVTELMAEAVELYSEVAEQKSIQIAVNQSAEVPPITGDRTRLIQVLANLIDNAIKYSAPGSDITTTVAPSEGGVLVTVADNGPGIEAADLSRIWERLYRGDQSRSERGLGLGLSLVRAIVEAHGGRATVESTPGHGSRFLVWLPREMTQM